MKKLIVTLAALLFTSPAFASLDHWTCSNDTTVLYMVLNTDEGNFMLWNDKGQFLAAAKFTEKSETPNGLPFLAAFLDNGLDVAVAKKGDNLILVISNVNNADKNAGTSFICN